MDSARPACRLPTVLLAPAGIHNTVRFAARLRVSLGRSRASDILVLMGRGVSELIARLADELGGLATVRVKKLGGGAERVELLPRNPAAAKLAIEHHPHGEEDEELWITVGDEAAPEEPGDLESLEIALRAVVAGRVRVLEGSGRYRVEIEVNAGDVRHSTSHDLVRGLLPAPGWRQRAKVTHFEPY
jgi:hypothetical protein